MNIDELKTGDVVWVKSVVTDDGDLTITDTTDYEVAYIDRSDLEDMSPKDVILKGHAEQSLKPEVPQFVAEWYEKNKNDLHKEIYNLHHRIMTLEKPYDKIYTWYGNNFNAMKTLINMHQFGYEIKKEKLYTVEIPNPNDKQIALRLEKWVDEKVIIIATHSSNNFTNDMLLTEQEIRKDFDWAWREEFPKEVTE
ncbi:TPA: DUF1642 domain-containing protein [Streptococcus equi subsp. zooepidemicus]|nr:DUF1642 domain-containing protein [Streptococcus equi subsp. zooepidemicus]HEL0595230.1 DUF1642 domain-containing protein [Streptococcus equi subsp. zooepidemicus]HEL0702675.1 DUF1642 domain-containing protein [Streptococcus equi subsp. zooepidemicus]HEL0718238.1 DUF1642 domain-containing protein [Streptococcus equi subsp. zooepidemicus]HEL0816672.1 DUF1642 domain-containing protein [Streptococcus equi subsp. zooepidemicus]